MACGMWVQSDAELRELGGQRLRRDRRAVAAAEWRSAICL